MMKKYPFSAAKHQHDITLAYNRVRNTIDDLVNEDWSKLSQSEKSAKRAELDRLETLLEKFTPIYHAVYQQFPVAWFTGAQYQMAKAMVIAATEFRAGKCIEQGRIDLLKYCVA